VAAGKGPLGPRLSPNSDKLIGPYMLVADCPKASSADPKSKGSQRTQRAYGEKSDISQVFRLADILGVLGAILRRSVSITDS
jgi:hypothetical protein